MSWQTATALVIVGAFVCIIGYDLFAYARGGNAATISRVCLDTANRYRGFGHLFLPQHVSK